MKRVIILCMKVGPSHVDTFDYKPKLKVHIHDWHATILHLLGLDHQRLTYRHAGLEIRLTEMKGQIVQGVLA